GWPRMATSRERNVRSRLSRVMNVARITPLGSGLANNAAPIYANRASVSHLNMRAIRRYEQRIWSARMIAAVGTIIQEMGIGTITLTPAAMAPMSAPTLIVLAAKRPTTAAYSSGRG